MISMKQKSFLAMVSTSYFSISYFCFLRGIHLTSSVSFFFFVFLQKLDMSSCQRITPVGLSSVFSCTRCLEQVTLAYGSSVSLYTSLCLSGS